MAYKPKPKPKPGTKAAAKAKPKRTNNYGRGKAIPLSDPQVLDDQLIPVTPDYGRGEEIPLFSPEARAPDEIPLAPDEMVAAFKDLFAAPEGLLSKAARFPRGKRFAHASILRARGAANPRVEGDASLPTMEELLASQGNHAVDLGSFDDLAARVSSMETPFAKELAEKQLALELLRVSQGGPETLYKVDRSGTRRGRGRGGRVPMAAEVAEAQAQADRQRFTEVRMPGAIPNNAEVGAGTRGDVGGGGFAAPGFATAGYGESAPGVVFHGPQQKPEVVEGAVASPRTSSLMDKVGMGAGALGGVAMLAQLLGGGGGSVDPDLGGLEGLGGGESDPTLEMRHMLQMQQAMTPRARPVIGNSELDEVIRGEADRLAAASIPMRRSLAEIMAERGFY